jgi:beta-galactosidase
MKNILCIIFIIFSSITALHSEEPEWTNPAVSRVNEEQPRAYFVHYPSEQIAGFCEPSKSPWFMALNGSWQYNLVPRPQLRPKEFPLPTFDASTWERIAIPEKDESKRNLDSIITFSKDNNPVASYRKIFPIPEDWYNSQIMVRFDGVSQAFYVWLNGKRVGYTESGMHGAEFNITPYVQLGRMNTLAVQVYGWSDGALVEQTDSVWGIYSNVTVNSIPNIAIRDFSIKTGIDTDNKTGNFALRVNLINYSKEITGKHSLIISLKDDKNKDIFTPIVQGLNAAKKGDTVFNFSQSVQHIKPWQSNDANLYSFVVTLRDKDNKVIDAISSKIGFRNISKKGNEIQVNTSVVNTDSVALLQSFRTLNAFDNCNKQGIYLTDKLVQPKGNNTAELLYRAQKHYERDKNMTCIIRWSIGNQENSESFEAINNWIFQTDKTRIIE